MAYLSRIIRCIQRLRKYCGLQPAESSTSKIKNSRRPRRSPPGEDGNIQNTMTSKHSWLTGILTGWGIRESWAKLIAGAVIGALAAAGLM